ncbi:hypothetical protein AB3S75_001712 [Citrus x aurantiifolia]
MYGFARFHKNFSANLSYVASKTYPSNLETTAAANSNVGTGRLGSSICCSHGYLPNPLLEFYPRRTRVTQFVHLRQPKLKKTEVKGRACRANRNFKSSSTTISEEDLDMRKGPWTVEEDFKLINYIATHGEGRWNSLARCAGLKRTGKSCRLRWLNYLRPNVRLGKITLEEQLLILELHSRWGNRWSKLAQHLPGRTDNEIKNYWRTRVQKQAKQLKCDVNSKQFKDSLRYLWMPRLNERIQANKSSPIAATPELDSAAPAGTATPTAATAPIDEPASRFINNIDGGTGQMVMQPLDCSSTTQSESESSSKSTTQPESGSNSSGSDSTTQSESGSN